MEKLSWRRFDESGRDVVAELWIENGEIKMLRIITDYKVGNEETKFRSDFPNDGSHAYRAAIKREMTQLKKYKQVIEMLEKELEVPEPNQEEALDGLAFLAHMLQDDQN